MSDRKMQRDLNPHKYAVAAMWLFHDRYAKEGLGSMGFWDSLSESDRRLCWQMVTAIESADHHSLVSP